MCEFPNPCRIVGSPISQSRSIANMVPCRYWHKNTSFPSLYTNIAPVMSWFPADIGIKIHLFHRCIRTSHPLCLRFRCQSQNAPHQSPIWIEAESLPGITPLVPRHPTQSSVPNRVQSCLYKIDGSASAVQTRNSSRFGRNANNDGQLRSPIEFVGYTRPYPGSSQPTKPIPETSTWHHRVPDA